MSAPKALPMRRIVVATLVMLSLASLAALGRSAGFVVPNGWIVHEPRGMMTMTDTMPQGAAASADGGSH